MEKGFSLVEVLVAIAILTGAIVTLAMIMARSASTNTAARRTTYATLLAADKLEHFRSLPFGDAALTTSTTDTLTADCDGFFDDPAAGFHRRWSIVPLATSPFSTEAVVVTVSVSWGDSSPQALLTTLKVRRAA